MIYLSKLKFPVETDKGERKAFAHNLYMLYLNNDRNLEIVKRAMIDYYPENDSQVFFDSFYAIIESR